MMNSTDYKIKTLAELQLYAMEQDNEARRILEKSMLNAVIIHAREVFILRVTMFIFGLVISLSLINNLELMCVALIILALFLVHGAVVSIEVMRTINSAFEEIESLRLNLDSTRDDIKSAANI